MSFKEYREWFETIFGKKATLTILDEEQECISEKNDLEAFFNSYERIIPKTGNQYVINGCNECVTKGLIVRQQDTPGFIGKLSKIKYVIIGLEARLPHDMDIHIAFEQFETSKKVHPLFEKLKVVFPDNPDLKKRAYVTDIAKCNSNDFNRSRKKCFKTHFQEELKILLKFNPELKIILQGTKVESYFPKDDFEHLKGNKSDNEVKTGKKFLFKRKLLQFEGREIPTILLPHVSKQTSSLWKKIEEPENLRKITKMLQEFNF